MVPTEQPSAPAVSPSSSSVPHGSLDVPQGNLQHGPVPLPPYPQDGHTYPRGRPQRPMQAADGQPVLDASTASALQFVQQLLPPAAQLPGAVGSEQQTRNAAHQQQQGRHAPVAWHHPHQLQNPPQWLPQQLVWSRPPHLPPQQLFLQPPPFLFGPPVLIPPPHLTHPYAPPLHFYPPLPPPPLDISDLDMFPPLTAAPSVPATADPPNLFAAADSVVTAAGQQAHAEHLGEQASSAAAAAANSSGIGAQKPLGIIRSRLAQLTPDWPEALRLAAVEALLLEQQQQLSTGSTGTASCRSDAPVTLYHGKRVPVLGRVVTCTAADVSDMVYLRAARRLQEELQACWVAGIPLPDVGGNLLLPDQHTENSSGSSSGSLNALDLFNLPSPSLTAAAEAAGAVGDAVQLPRMSCQELTYALFSVWGAAPKVTTLISTTAAATAVQQGAGVEQLQGGPPAQYMQLPPELQSWCASGGLSTTLLSSLQHLTAAQQLSSTAALPGTQQTLLAVQPQRGVDFGMNQVDVVADNKQQRLQQQQQQLLLQQVSHVRRGHEQQQQQKQQNTRSKGGQQGNDGLYVERELVIVNVDTNRDVLLLNVCLAPEYPEWVSLSDPAGIAADLQPVKQQLQQYTQQQQQQQDNQQDIEHQLTNGHSQQHVDQSSGVHSTASPTAVLLPPGGRYTVTVRLSTSSSRPRSQAELGVISQACFVTAAVAADGATATQPAAVAAASTSHPVLSNGNNTNSSSSSSSTGSSSAPPGWHVVVCGVPVAGGLVSHLSELQSVLRAEAKPFISAALRRVFVTPPAAGAELAFLPAPRDLCWDVHMDRWRLFNGLSFLPAADQPGQVPAADVAQLTLRRFQAMMSADVSTPGPQAPLLTWGPPVLQQWQRLLLLEEHACERDIASYSVFNIRVAAAVFGAAAVDGEQQQQQSALRRYSISPWPAPPQEGAEMFTYRGPDLSCLLGAGREARLAVISVPGLPENRPGLITGDVVYLRLASPISPTALSQLTQQLTQQLAAAQSAAASTSPRLQKQLTKSSKLSGRQPNQEYPANQDQLRNKVLQQEKQEMHKVTLPQQLLLQQLMGHNLRVPLHVEVAGLVAAVDGSRCLLAMPDSWWLLLQELYRYDQQQGRRGAWGDAPAAADPLLVHVCFCLNRTGHGRMQALLPYLAVSRRLLLPPGLLTGTGQGSFGGQQPAAAAVAAAVSSDLVANGGIAPPDKQQEIWRTADSLSLAGGVPLNLHQRLAVSTLLAGGGVAAPYVLFGPPGTGKTVTLVEAVLQYRRAHPSARILCCAPANYSADLLCSALAAAGVGVGEMCRLNDPRRPVAQAKQDTLRYCLIKSSLQTFSLDQGLREAARRPIVVCSTTTAGLLLPQPNSSRPSAAVAIRAPGAPAPATACNTNWWQQQMQSLLGSSGLFDLVVVDESGQGLAPEVLLPLSLARPKAPVLLAGDPRQLGPVLRSATAAAAGLGVSLLDSWIHYWHTVLPQLAAAAAAMEQQQQQQGQHQKGHISTAAEVSPAGPVALCYGMLVDNYRSHKRLLDLPSRLFYNGMLRACAPAAAVAPPHWSEIMVSSAGQADEHDAENEHEIPSAAVNDAEDKLSELCPSSCLFVGVNGQQRQDGDAPSYYNPQEVLVLAELITSLLGTPDEADGGTGRQAAVSVQDIGVITTYRRQVQKIRLLLRERGLGAVRVGTVDDYQGQEERIIFISTTLSKPESLPPPLPDMVTLQQRQGQQQQGSGSTHESSDQGHGMAWGSGPSGLSDVGFWRNPKRFNVAITRAKALLVVIGSPRVLVADDNWRQLLQHCVARGAYRGAGSTFLQKLLRVGATPVGTNEPAASDLPADLYDLHEGLLGAGDDDSNLASAVQAVVEAAQLGVGAAEVIFPQTLDEYYAACEEDQPWKVAI